MTPAPYRRPAARTAAVALGFLILAAAAEAPRAAAQGKKTFTPELKVAPLKEDKEERQLPGTISDVCVGGGGRFLILTLSSEKKIAIFDVNEAKVVKYLPVNDENVSAAASLDKLVIVNDGKLNRYSLETLEKEGSIALPGGKGAVLFMGSASRGPLVGLVDGKPGFVDPNTLKALKTPILDIGRDRLTESATRISADGRVITTYRPGSSPQGHTAYIRAGNEYKAVQPDNKDVSGHFAPGPDGRYLYCAIGTLTAAGKSVGKLGAYGDGSKYSLPAAEGEGFFLRIDVPGFPHGDKKKAGKVFLHAAGESKPIAELTGVTPPMGLNHWGREKFGVDKRFFLVPSAKLLIYLPETLDKLELHRVDPAALLDQADYEYLVVVSRPPREAIVGTPYVYEPVVKSKKGGVKMKLDSGPKGMKLDGGKLTWDPVGALIGKDVPVTVAVSDDSGRDVFHTFKLEVRGK